MIALATYPIITPIINSVTFPFTFCDTYTISAITDKAPITAANESATSPIYPSLLSATPPNAPDSNTTKATPRLAPELIPSTEGPASGLRNTVCICKPLMESPAPATKAVRACGTRDFQIIFCQIMDSSVPPQSMFHTEPIGMETEPKRRFNRKKIKIDAAISNIRGTVGRFIRQIN